MTASTLRIVLAQLNFTVGDFGGNRDKIIAAIKEARDKMQADLIVFTELAITGYPPEDFLHRTGFYHNVEKSLEKIKQHAQGIDILVGYPEKTKDGIYNAAVWMRDKKIITNYRKQELPNYGVFDEDRYFKSDTQTTLVTIKGVQCAICICEDIWIPGPIIAAKKAGAQCIISLNASPYSMHKAEIRKHVFQNRTKETGLPIFFVNCNGGQDELIFDGDSQVVNGSGKPCAHAGYFQEKLLLVEAILKNGVLEIQKQIMPSMPSQLTNIYQALVMGVKDYVNKNNFPGVIIGLSGGIDSALTLAIAVDALGADKITTVMLPSQYTAKMSLEDAAEEAKILKVEHKIIPIKSIFDSFLKSLAVTFAGLKQDVTEENIQARIRGTILMALSNKTGNMVLTTGNKSEMAVGYSTLYGDMAGGFCVLKDVCKTLVYQLANYRNSVSQVIPQRVIDRPPSAELAPDQTDQDTLPAYDVLDKILELFVEQDLSIHEIIAQGFDENIVNKITRMVFLNEYKRRQAPPGPRITEKAFGRDRRYPITFKFSY
jgi:NAD+ synthase (glutamine-hydrolysing)